MVTTSVRVNIPIPHLLSKHAQVSLGQHRKSPKRNWIANRLGLTSTKHSQSSSRQPSRPDQPYQAQARQLDRQPSLQRQPSRPDQQQHPYQDPRVRQPQPSRPTLASDIALSPPMADNYQYTPVQSVTPALMRAPSAPGSSLSAASESQYSQSQYSLSAPIRPYADGMLIRGNSDDELDKTDVFWRRFNASAVQQQLPDAEKSSWLEKTQGKRSQHSRILWVVGIIFVLLAVGGIGIGVFLSFHNDSSATRPSTFGGAQDATSAGAAAATIGGGGGGGGSGGGDSGGLATSSSPHVSPTNTIADR
ncbi:hypothetical protein DFH08DRAFT_1005320 [Mycena albidolilacea]|uniref:Uncharacterized protein n=1 Tax=Mycena albidolilacea TaxID=1033008 RepID=A0AAD7ASJ0_9AGAR|nr:hypothetical protein DFH08DRAFT_1005320 [Mycena albidolilacea]